MENLKIFREQNSSNLGKKNPELLMRIDALIDYMKDGDTSKPFKMPKLSKHNIKYAVDQTENFEKKRKNEIRKEHLEAIEREEELQRNLPKHTNIDDALDFLKQQEQELLAENEIENFEMPNYDDLLLLNTNEVDNMIPKAYNPNSNKERDLEYNYL